MACADSCGIGSSGNLHRNASLRGLRQSLARRDADQGQCKRQACPHTLRAGRGQANDNAVLDDRLVMENQRITRDRQQDQALGYSIPPLLLQALLPDEILAPVDGEPQACLKRRHLGP